MIANENKNRDLRTDPGSGWQTNHGISDECLMVLPCNQCMVVKFQTKNAFFPTARYQITHILYTLAQMGIPWRKPHLSVARSLANRTKWLRQRYFCALLTGCARSCTSPRCETTTLHALESSSRWWNGEVFAVVDYSRSLYKTMQTYELFSLLWISCYGWSRSCFTFDKHNRPYSTSMSHNQPLLNYNILQSTINQAWIRHCGEPIVMGMIHPPSICDLSGEWDSSWSTIGILSLPYYTLVCPNLVAWKIHHKNSWLSYIKLLWFLASGDCLRVTIIVQ